MSSLVFDAFAYAHQLRDVGITEQQAEVIARKTAEVLQIAEEVAKEEIHAGELATKRDLKEVETILKRDLKEVDTDLKRDLKALELQVLLQIEKSKNATLLWMFTMLSAFAGTMVAVMAKGFHWF